uniref:Enkurin domain containing 1 n=1 Tax=Strix occidentalis caurina TaxID=311401 RepID=A0A8D0KUT8_STROC
MCEGPSRISGPIPPDPTLFPNYYKRPFSARGRLKGNAQKLDFTSAQPVPRIRPSGRDFLEKGQKGTLSLLLQLEGISLDGGLPVKRKESKDHEKENVRRIKEIQKKCKEKERAQEHSQPKPVKALWKSQKYENVESKVKAKLQAVGFCPVDHGLQAASSLGPALPTLWTHSGLYVFSERFCWCAVQWGNADISRQSGWRPRSSSTACKGVRTSCPPHTCLWEKGCGAMPCILKLFQWLKCPWLKCPMLKCSEQVSGFVKVLDFF